MSIKLDKKSIVEKLKEHWLFMSWVILLTILPYIAFGPEMGHTYGIANIAKIVSFICVIGMLVLVYMDNPSYDKLIWVVVILIAACMIAIMMQTSQYRQDKKENIHWDRKL